MKKLFVVFIATLLLSACNSIRVGYGGISQEMFKSKEAIVYEYDPLLTSEEEISEKANEHCALFDKKAEITKRSSSGSLGLVKLVTWNCVSN